MVKEDKTMKKIIILLSAFAAMVSCQKEGLNNNETSNPDGNIVVFYVETSKISIGEKEDDKIPLLWEEGDALDIYSADLSEQLGTATLSSGAGEKNASFTFNGTIADNTDVVLVYPAGSGNIIPKEQNEAEIHGCASTTVIGGQASFTLQHPAYVKFALGSEAMGGWKVKEILFDCYKVPLSGTYAYSSDTFAPATEVSLTGSTDGGFKVTLDEPALLSSNPEVLAVAIPADLTGKTVFVTLKLEKDGQETVVSKKIIGKELKANAINTIKWQDVDHVYTDLTTPVVFKCYDNVKNTSYEGMSEYLEQYYPMWAITKGCQEGKGNTYGTGNGILLNFTYGQESTAYGDFKTSVYHVAQDADKDGLLPLTYTLASSQDGQFGIYPVYQDDAMVFHVPVTSAVNGKTLRFAIGVRGSIAGSPKDWIAEYSLDGTTWAKFTTGATVSCSKTSAAVYIDASQAISGISGNSIIHLRLRANGSKVISSDSVNYPGTRSIRIVFGNAKGTINFKTTYGGPAIWVE